MRNRNHNHGYLVRGKQGALRCPFSLGGDVFWQRPCRKVRQDGITGIIGCADPDKAMAECPYCDHKCPWWDRIEKKVDETLVRVNRISARLQEV